MRSILGIDYVERAGTPLALDLYLPDETPPTGLILFAHGGGFVKGNRTTAPAEKLAKRLTALGAAVASISYRLRTEDLALPVRQRRHIYANRKKAISLGVKLAHNHMGPRFEAARQDVGEAITFLRNGSGPYDFSQSEFGLIGISAGGMIGLSLAFPDPLLPRFEKPACVVTLGAALQHPWTLQKDAPPCLMLHSVEDRIVPTENCSLIKPYIDEVHAPVTVQLCERRGHKAPVHALFRDSAPDGTPYWLQALALLRQAGVLNPLPAGV
jgi:predicted esterase